MEGLIGRNFAFQNGLSLTIKAANCNFPWAYIREGLLSEGYLRLRFGGLIFGSAYYRNFTVSVQHGIVKICSLKASNCAPKYDTLSYYLIFHLHLSMDTLQKRPNLVSNMTCFVIKLLKFETVLTVRIPKP